MANKKSGPQAPVLEPTGQSSCTEDYSQVEDNGNRTDDKLTRENKGVKKSQTTQLVEMVISDGLELFHDEQKTGFGRMRRGGHWEIYALDSVAFKDRLATAAFSKLGFAPQEHILKGAVNTLRARAIHDSPEYPVHVRVVQHDGRIYLDLCNEDWEVVEISPEGWRIVTDSPVRFLRMRDACPLPRPEEGGMIEALKALLNLQYEQDFVLIVGWLIGVVWGKGGCPLLIVQGDQGSAKSTAAKILKMLVDPSLASVRPTPKNEQDLAIAAKNCRVLAMDNVSKLPPWLSDALCRVATGAGFATRKLYTDCDESIICVQNPVILNGITEFAERADLLERAIVIHLPRIPDSKRRTEDSLYDELKQIDGKFLGALLDIISVGLGRIDKINPEHLPRMADFAKVVIACEPACPWNEGDFRRAYEANRRDADSSLIQGSFPEALLEFGRTLPEGEWTGTATELLSRLSDLKADDVRYLEDWPRSPKALSGELTRLRSVLGEAGVSIRHHRSSDRHRRRLITLTFDDRIGEVGRVRTQPSPGVSATGTPSNAVSDATDELDAATLSKNKENRNRREIEGVEVEGGSREHRPHRPIHPDDESELGAERPRGDPESRICH